LGVLVALNAVLRFIEVAIPGPGGFTPIFFLILTTATCLGRASAS
jgi:energy-coupling factor transport system substrate-specific component